MLHNHPRRVGRFAAVPALLSAAVLACASLVGGDSELEMGRRLAVQAAVKTTVAIECRLQQGMQPMGFFGTGVLISRDGHILTDITVVPDRATSIRVWVKGEQTIYNAKLIEVNTATEGALIQITGNRHDFPCAELLDTTKLPLGTHIYTMGNPLQALKNDDQVAVSSGIISGMYKLNNADTQSKYNGLVIETDAAVNPGSDGGPIFDEKGRLAGIITLGFEKERLQGCAIPAHVLSTSMKSLQEIVKTYDGGRLRTPTAPTDPLEAALGAAAVKIAPFVVRIDVIREPDTLPPMPGGLSQNQAAQAQAQLKAIELTLRPNTPVTGLWISKDEILTSAAMVTSTNKIMGALKSASWKDSTGTAHSLTLVGYNELMDVALLKIDGYEADSIAALQADAAPEVGAGVAVVGRIQGSSGFTFTKGMVSAVGRGLGPYQAKAYQTDALINYGNTGGPVVDIRGVIVGLAGQCRVGSSWGQSAGVGFFTGTKDLLAILPELRAGKRIKAPSRTFLGIEQEPKTAADELDGIVIKKVETDSAAAKGGLKDGDRIIAVDGEPSVEAQELLRKVTQKRPGDRLILLVQRAKEELELIITLGAQKEQDGDEEKPKIAPPGDGDGLDPAAPEKPADANPPKGF
ncbi:MAG TPA: trypsin-like peptidase domain-containing protein [Planctomycetota bacterium]|nr:trypsin-like peptidase domain-containing protein [Planctomycetota bacterium]